MFLWLIKQILTIRNVVAGRNHPHQLAWGLAFGLMLGIIPHGNLLAIGLVVLVICLNVNHAMVAISGVAVSFFAMKLDPYSHQIGQFVLLHPELGEPLASAWRLPLIPWTDLNNTIVMGSALIGVAALLPTYVLSYPFFRLLAPSAKPEDDQPTEPDPPRENRKLSQRKRGHRPEPANAQDSPRPRVAIAAADRHEQPGVQRNEEPIVFTPLPRVDAAAEVDVAVEETPSVSMSAQVDGASATLETQIDVIRLKDYRADDPTAGVQAPVTEADNAQINQALNFLLRRLRNSQQEKAA